MTGTFRAATILTAFVVLTVPLMPVQALLVRVSTKAARQFPHWYHRQVCRLLGIRFVIDGRIEPGRPTLLVANHTSWLDIPVLSAVAPVSFVAKKEVGSWPFVSSLARLQRTVFVDRERRLAAGQSANAILARLALGDAIVLFAEGTSSDGNRVLPFKTSLFGAVKPSSGSADGGHADAPGAVVQTIAVVYTKLHGIPIGRADRPLVGWYGDMEMQSHAWQLLKAGPLDVVIRIGPPMPLHAFAGRKELAAETERDVRQAVLRVLRNRGPDETIEAAQMAVPVRRPSSAPSRDGAPRKWT